MKKVILVFGGILIGLTAFGQTEKQTTAPQQKTASRHTVPQQIEALEDMVKRFGETHPESLKAKQLIANLNRDHFDEIQKHKSETLSPTEYDTWKQKQATLIKNNTTINEFKEKK